MRSVRKFGLFLLMGLFVLFGLVFFGNSLETQTPQVLSPKKVAVGPGASNNLNGEIVINNLRAEPIMDETTKRLGGQIAQHIKSLNNDGLVSIDDKKYAKALNPENIANSIINEELEKINNIDLGFNDIKLAKINIDYRSDKKMLAGYFISFQEVINKNFATQKIDWEEFNKNNFDEMISAYDKAIAEFYKLKVPASALDIHKQQISLMIQQKIVMTKLRDVDSNPLEALAALKYNPSIDAGFKEVTSKVLNLLKTNQISI